MIDTPFIFKIFCLKLSGAIIINAEGWSKPTIFKKYAATNMHEFFVVAMEVFFEQPDMMKKHCQTLYTATCMLLKQDPLAEDVGALRL